MASYLTSWFQHAAARRRLVCRSAIMISDWLFQHAAARRRLETPPSHGLKCKTFQHAAARRRLGFLPLVAARINFVSTRSRPKAAGRPEVAVNIRRVVSTRSRPKAAEVTGVAAVLAWMFQHAAARRRLADLPKSTLPTIRFNTQPPEGGWSPLFWRCACLRCFNTQPPEGGWQHRHRRLILHQFQHAAARRRL